MENVEMDICISTSKHFHYAYDCLHMEFQKKHQILYKKWIHPEWDAKNKEKQIR
jgi:hypothetical protein